MKASTFSIEYLNTIKAPAIKVYDALTTLMDWPKYGQRNWLSGKKLIL
jgi:hypothetical protein